MLDGNVSNDRYMLYADDDEDDKAILIEMMRRISPEVKIATTDNGLEAIRYLDELPLRSTLPCCIVLDMNMPVMNGIQTLEAIKTSEVYRTIPVFLFSTSSNPTDVAATNELGAEAFVTKPYGQKELFEICEEFADYCRRPLNRKEIAHAS